MTYKEQLRKAKELGLSIIDLVVADECMSVFTFSYTDEEFERLCELVKTCYLKSDGLDEYCIASAVNELIEEDKKTIAEILEISYYVIIDKATWFA
jgi:hypothetical protein